MKAWSRLLAGLGLAGVCFFTIAGCGGGSDIPDASSEGTVASGGGSSAPAVTPESTPAPTAAPAATPDAAAEGPKVAQNAPAPKAEEPPPEAAAPTPEPEAPAAETAPKTQPGQAKSSTAEMLAMSSGSGSPTPPADGSAGAGEARRRAGNTPPAAGGAPGPGPGGMAMMRPGGPGGMRPGGPGMMAGGTPPMGPGAPGQGGTPAMGPGAPGQGAPRPEDMMKMATMQGRNGMAPNAPGGPQPGGPGGPGGANDAPADFHTPEGAVTAFLNALKAKDVDRLNESTALRAHVEASSARNRELFQKIFDLSLTDSELADIASKLEGYTIASENPPKSTARVDVILQKRGDKGNTFQRTVTVRHEKKGWGVLDVSGAREFKALNAMPRRKRPG